MRNKKGTKRKQPELKETPKEFENFEEYKEIVKAMVDKDEEKYIQPLYEQGLKGYGNKLFVKYEPDFETAIDTLNSFDRDIIIVTRIPLIKKENKKKSSGTHSVILIKIGNQYIFYDPNGVVDANESSLFYFLHQKKQDTKQLIEYIQNRLGKILSYSAKHGYQFRLDSDREDGWIHGGGYCMFVNYFFIRWIINMYKSNFKQQEIIKNIKQVLNKEFTDNDTISGYKNNRLEVFPPDENLGPEAFKEIKKVLKV